MPDVTILYKLYAIGIAAALPVVTLFALNDGVMPTTTTEVISKALRILIFSALWPMHIISLLGCLAADVGEVTVKATSYLLDAIDKLLKQLGV